jgi:hypothetical protein
MKFCNNPKCKKLAERKRQIKYEIRVRAEKAQEKENKLDSYFNSLDFQGMDFLMNNFNEKSEVRSTAFMTSLKLNWFEVLERYGKNQELIDALIREFIVFHNETGSQSVKLFAESIGSSSRFFKFIDKQVFHNAINPEKRVHSNELLTMSEVKERLSLYESNLSIISDEYLNSHTELLLKCHVCKFEFFRPWMKVVSEKAGCPACNSNGGKYTINDIATEVEKYNYSLLKHTGGSRTRGTKFTVKCYRGHVYETDFVEFKTHEHKKGGSCKTCIKQGYGKSRMKVKEEMLSKMKSLGYSTEEEFIHTQERMTFKCENGHIRINNLNGIFQFPSCPECAGRIVKHTEQTVAKALDEIGLEYIGDFTGTKEFFTYRCNCGNVSEGMYYYLLDGSRCNDCSKKKFWRYKDVKEYFASHGSELLSECYNNDREPLEFKCACERVSKKAFASFKYSPMCRECVVESIPTGSGHHNWNPDLSDEHREHDRNYPEYREWRKAVYERDDYICQCCGTFGQTLCAHHILSYTDFPDLRVAVTNGITLCETCHVEFHIVYGYKGFDENDLQTYIEETQETLAEFIKIKTPTKL